MEQLSPEVLAERIKALDRRIDERFIALDKALKLASDHQEAWRHAANEWRQAMTDRERDFLPRNLGYVIAALSLVGAFISIADKFR